MAYQSIYTGAQIDEAIMMAQRRQASNVVVNSSAFAADATYEDFPYRASVSIENVTADMIPEVTFSVKEAISGIFAPVAEAYDGGIYIYAAEVPESDISIPTIICWKAAGSS